MIGAGLVLTLAEFPRGVAASEVSADTTWRLGAWYVPIILSLWLLMVAAISRYSLDRETHEENLRRLAQRSTASSDSGTAVAETGAGSDSQR